VLALLAGIGAGVVVLGIASFDELAAAIRFAWQFERLGRNAQGCLEYRHRQTGIVFVKLPGGAFLMGSPEDEDGRSTEEFQHQVALSAFLIAKYEVTQAEWRRVMGSEPAWSKGEDLPVESVTWDDCQEFCEKSGLSLPSEAQWEYACRAGTTGPFAGVLDELGWCSENSQSRTHAVGEKRPNGFGLHDMHGNVWEWCLDAYERDFYRGPVAAVKDPLCEGIGRVPRVLRGTGWSYHFGGCRSALRHHADPRYRSDEVGFRPARSVP
jgi:formylglycine-generating enzyme required for sulfatase activity